MQGGFPRGGRAARGAAPGAGGGASGDPGGAQPGTLFVVATPIGNLEDVSHRALRVLREVSIVACEDTRVTRVLLARYGIGARTTSYHERNRERAAPGLLARLARGESVALVSDAGTPGISDPAAHLVALAVERAIPVVPVPGPSALLAALVASGLPTARFLFEGFLPRGGRERRDRLARLAVEPRTIVIYEAVPRLAGTLRDLAALLGPRRAVVAREITKRFEEFLRGTLPALAETAAGGAMKGEVVVVIEGAGEGRGTADDAGVPSPRPPEDLAEATGPRDPLAAAAAEVARLVAEGARPSEAVSRVACSRGVPRRALYRLYLDSRQEDEG